MRRRSFRDLKVWQRGMELAVAVYEVTKLFPADERFGLTSQLRRCSVSIPSNIAEGAERESGKDFARYLKIARGSSAELQTQLALAKRLEFAAGDSMSGCEALSAELERMLTALIETL